MASITLAGSSLTYAENSAAIALDAAAQFDASGLPANLAGYELTVALSSGALPSDRLSLEGSEVTLDGRIVKVNGQEVATLSGGLGGEDFNVLFGNNADAAAVQAVLRSIRYENWSDSLTTGDRQVAVSLGTLGQTVIAPVVKAVAVTGIDDLPTVSQTLTLYDGTTGKRPDEAGSAVGGPWLSYIDQFETFGSGSIDAVADANGTVLTTDLAVSGGISNYQAGIGLGGISLTPVNAQFPVLDRNLGYTFSFSGQVLSEERSSSANKNNDGKDDRAGFSLALISQDQQGIALNFFEDRIWAHEDGLTQSDPSLEPDSDPPSDFRTLFTQAEGVDVDTTQLNRYDVSVKGNLYQLSSNGVTILQGKLRDYTDYEPPTVAVPILGDIPLPDFNELPSLVFLGDLSPSAGASTRISEISVSTPSSNPTITVDSGNIGTFPELLIDDLDGETAETNVTLTVERGSFAPSSDVNLALTTNNVSGGGGRLQILGALGDINSYLSDSSRLGYQSEPGFSGAVPIAVDFDLQTEATRTDFNGDGQNDLLLYNPQQTWSGIGFMGEAGGISGSTSLWTGWSPKATGDFNNDGQTDIVVEHIANDWHGILYMDGSTIQSSQGITGWAGWDIIGAGNFNNDGTDDILIKYQTQDWYGVLNMGGADGSQAQSSTGIAVWAGWDVKGAGDFNGDGRMELIAQHQTESWYGILELDANQQIVGSQSIAGWAGWDIIGTSDQNEDGQTDLLIKNQAEGWNGVWLMNGNQITGSQGLNVWQGWEAIA